jgi:DNA-binding NtrC family response regulator
MLRLLATARQVAPGGEAILITGETGTGKEMLARVIHKYSARADRDFVPFNCTSVPKDMVESQLFGHRRGAFTGAQDDAPGVLRAADGGTLLLDEVGDLESSVQPKLLRFLEGQEVHPLGEPKPVKVDVRVIAATNADIDELVSDGRFREDLFYRLNIIRLDVPPLRERREEIPPLVYHFLRRFGAERGLPHLKMTDPALKCLLLYEWPGNVRRLANVVRRAVALVGGNDPIGPELLPPEIIEAGRVMASAVSAPHVRLTVDNEIRIRADQPLRSAVDTLERAMMEQALAAAGGNSAAAARALGISRKGFYLKRQRLNIPDLVAPEV